LLLGISLVSVVVARGEDQPTVVATTGMVADLVRGVAGDEVEVVQLMPPGVDPHLYKPTAGDAALLGRAGAVFYNGLRLEGRMGELFSRIERSGRPVVALGDSLPSKLLIEEGEGTGIYDPHIWFDADLWAQTVPAVVAGLSEVKPEAKDEFVKRGQAVVASLQELNAWCREQAEKIPVERRVLVTSHDAFGYFGRAYGFEVVGLQGISTVTEAGLAEVTALVDFLRERKIPAIFVETSVNPETLERVAEQAGVAVGGELFSDAMGEPGEERNGFAVGTYDGMMRYNMSLLVKGLGEAPE
jgi:manganese/zinc/iron transport system substrate-binding protein